MLLPAQTACCCVSVSSHQGCAQHLSKHTQISAKQPDLPFWLLKQYYTDNLATTADGTDTKQLKKKQAQLLSARAGAGDLAGVQWLRAQVKGCLVVCQLRL